LLFSMHALKPRWTRTFRRFLMERHGAKVEDALTKRGRAPASAGSRRLAPLRARPALGVSLGEQQSHYWDTEQKRLIARMVSFLAAVIKTIGIVDVAALGKLRRWRGAFSAAKPPSDQSKPTEPNGAVPVS
jgi:hypothetical protein